MQIFPIIVVSLIRSFHTIFSIIFVWLYHISSWKLLLAKFRLKLKKVGKISKPFRYDLNQIPYDCTVAVTNRFKGLDLIQCLKNYGQMFATFYRRRWPKPSPLRRAYKQLRKERKQKTKEKRKDIPNWMQSSWEKQVGMRE